MATMSLAAYSLFPYDAGVPAATCTGFVPADAVRRCTPRHMGVMQKTEAMYSLAGLSLFPSVPAAKSAVATVGRTTSSSQPAQPKSSHTTPQRSSQSARPSRLSVTHHKNKSATTTRPTYIEPITTQRKHSTSPSAMTSSSSTITTSAVSIPRTSRRLPKQPLVPSTKPLILNATPALSPLPQYSPYDTARKTSGVETCVRRARSSTVIGVAKLDGHGATSFASRAARQAADGWPVPPTYVVKASITTIASLASEPPAPMRKSRLPSVVTSVSFSHNEHESPVGSSPPTPPPSRPLPALPRQSPSSYLAFPYIEHKRPGGIRKHKSVGIMRSAQSTADQPSLAGLSTALVTPGRPFSSTKDSLSRTKSFDRTRPRTLLPPLEMDTPSASLPPSLTTDEWSPASSNFSSYPPTPLYNLAKVDFGPCTTLDKLNFDWELASSIHTAATTRDSIDYFLHPLPGASAASLESGERARRRRSRSASRPRRPSRLGASDGVLEATPAASAPTKALPELPRLLTATEMGTELVAEESASRLVAEAGVSLGQNGVDSSGRQRSPSSPIWKKVKAGWHLPKLLRPKSWEKVGG